MNVKLLIDAIVRQTTVLIAQLSTTAGIRAPLAHVADQVFVDLVSAIESQGVGRKVVADMFGLALRTYQKKVQRLTESTTTRDLTLWQAVLDFIQSGGGATRSRIHERFKYDGEKNVAAVLNDLVTSGMVYKTGRGGSTVYGMTSEEDYRRLLDEDVLDSVSSLAWVTIYRHEGRSAGREALRSTIHVDDAILERALEVLIKEGRITSEVNEEGTEMFQAAKFLVPVGSEYGWEAAVFDHYQAVVTAINAKLSAAPGRSAQDDVIGGATLSFDISSGHAFESEVYGQLKAVRAQVNSLWEKVSQHNRENPIPDDHKIQVTFYFGQTVRDPEADKDDEHDEME